MTTPRVEPVAESERKLIASQPQRRWLDTKLAPLPALEDAEGDRLPTQLPPVVDAHVHLFPPRVFDAIWRWFENHAWPVRYKLHSQQVIDFLFQRGGSRFVALHYAHKPGVAPSLHQYIAVVCRAARRSIRLATRMPGEIGAAEIVQEAL